MHTNSRLRAVAPVALSVLLSALLAWPCLGLQDPGEREDSPPETQASETSEPAAAPEDGAPGDGEGEPEPERKEPTLLGEVTRDQIAVAEPEWVTAEIESEVDPMASMALGDVPDGAELTVYFGTWCGDSKREVSRFFRSLDEGAGLANFDLKLVAVDRRDGRPAEILEGLEVYWVPTFIVRREGEEVGRIVESSPNGIESDLLALLTGEVSGLITDREDGAKLPVEEEGDAVAEGTGPGDGTLDAPPEEVDEVLMVPGEGESGGSAPRPGALP